MSVSDSDEMVFLGSRNNEEHGFCSGVLEEIRHTLTSALHDLRSITINDQNCLDSCPLVNRKELFLVVAGVSPVLEFPGMLFVGLRTVRFRSVECALLVWSRREAAATESSTGEKGGLNLGDFMCPRKHGRCYVLVSFEGSCRLGSMNSDLRETVVLKVMPCGRRF
jgi:hypothetical protein